MAAANLRRAGIANASVREADGARGLPGEAPLDVIVLSGSVAEVPPLLLEQLKIGGRLAAIVGQPPVMRAMLVTRVAEQQWKHSVLFDTVAPRLQGFAEAPRFRF
jgi:protein-L-isoaspartate(D-aspartate) O-methyltransferase